ncbi:glycoside hydrolase family 3 protein [Subtercola endophyticus]|uniref:glycoside hydrolase family 3 protein n=1 Tax=Subtercola endophyticus TaxID=2895559 RepID=UPI001E59A596|nr:glycoside hydrolase family 3 C-terminal domain-containing protein [Subtercola endophyticus]UFS60628.1 glycoside hydrolase family 3 C-terminal domain-containing protein [Subtercola endophyticus]
MTDLQASAPAADSATGELEALLARLTLEEKVLLLTGHDFWASWPLPSIGLRRLLFSDGPSGVRGEVWDERHPSLNLPSATALGASWNTAIARRYGNAAAVEARRKGVDVVLGPTINLHRSPFGGRHFECFSEDPLLTADLAAAYVTGVQENGVAATPKHYIANDFETDRFTVNVVVADRPMRELYLAAFEKAIVEAHAWAVMSSYNSVNGATVTENDLLETPLNSEWGFDGIVVSDWTAVRSLNSARFSQDLAMPGPQGPWGEALVAAVRAGEIDESHVDRKVLRILKLAERVGALDGFEAAVPEPVRVEDGVAFVREAEIAGTVLVKNAERTGTGGTGGAAGAAELPWSPSELSSVAVIGHNARFARSQGGGSATVLPEYVVSPLAGITAALPDATVTYSVGAVVQEGIAELPLSTITNPATGEPGALVRFLDASGAELARENRRATALVWFGGDAPITASSVVEFTTRYTPEETGEILLGFAAAGNGRIYVNDDLLLEQHLDSLGTDLGAAFISPPTHSIALTVTAGEPIDVRIEFDIVQGGPLSGALSITVGIEPDQSNPDALIAEAVAAAKAADVAVVVVGTNAKVESEGFDRTSLALPGRQDELVRAVAAVNPRTVVIVNSGSPVLLPWRDEVSAILLSWFGGQEYGDALADILTGTAEPGGRLPTTWPKTEADVPVLDVTPVDGVVRYDEGIHIGYRAWLKAGTEPAYEFGFGLGYTTWSLDDVTRDAPTIAADETLTLEIGVTNTGGRRGSQVVQVYASRADSAIDRPVRWLVGFTTVSADPGHSVVTTIAVPARAFADWAEEGWHYEPGSFTLQIGTSVTDLPLTTDIEVTA